MFNLPFELEAQITFFSVASNFKTCSRKFWKKQKLICPPLVLGSDHLCECDLDVRKPLEDPCAQKDGNWNKAGNQAKKGGQYIREPSQWY